MTSVTIDAAAVWKKTNSTVILTLNRPNFLNTLTKDICVDVRQKLQEWKESLDVNCFIVKGSGKAFCAGGDVKALWRALSDANIADIGACF